MSCAFEKFSRFPVGWRCAVCVFSYTVGWGDSGFVRFRLRGLLYSYDLFVDGAYTRGESWIVRCSRRNRRGDGFVFWTFLGSDARVSSSVPCCWRFVFRGICRAKNILLKSWAKKRKEEMSHSLFCVDSEEVDVFAHAGC